MSKYKPKFLEYNKIKLYDNDNIITKFKVRYVFGNYRNIFGDVVELNHEDIMKKVRQNKIKFISRFSK